MIFWDRFSRTQCYPDSCSCEFVRQDSLIAQPWAFWSSLAYLVPVFLLPSNSKELRLFKWFLVLLTFASMFCHASFIKLSVALDFSSIGLVLGFFPLVRLLKGRNLPIGFTVFFLTQLAVNFYLPKWPKISLSLLIFVFAMVEVIQTFGINFLRSKSPRFSIVILVLSFLAFLLDDQKVFFCDTSGWFAGHTLWHYGTAWSIYFFAKWRFIDERLRLPSVVNDLR